MLDISTPVPKFKDPLSPRNIPPAGYFFRITFFSKFFSWINLKIRQCLQSNGSVWNWYEIGTDKLCVYMGLVRSIVNIDTVAFLL